MEKVTLYSFSSEYIRITIEAWFEDDTLVVEGYDIGKRVQEAWGDSDYEYSVKVKPGEVEKLYKLFSVEPVDRQKLLEAVAARFNGNHAYSLFCDFLESNGIKSEGFSWT
jgi:hypothetical protein